ncbi:MAG: Integral rane protein TerC family [Myxococcaceae bacterium]|nr:Integral rane protein TerC family [Myxococcaceae bacterium]
MAGSTTALVVPVWAWLVLAGIVASGLLIDLVAHRGDRQLNKKSAILWSAAWVTLGLAFGGWVALQFGREAGEDYVTAFLVEKSLSVDNLFVFLVIFKRLQIPAHEQHRVLQWGIIGAFVTRAAFIAAGAAVLSGWHDVIYILGTFLVFTGIKTAREKADAKDENDEGKVLTFLRRHLRFTPTFHGHRFLVVENGRRVATPLLLALIVIEITDVIFALDSIPAVFAISEEPFIVYSSNIFAMLGLRALYLVLADLLADLKYLRYGLAAILVFAGGKMLTSGLLHVPHVVSLLTIAGILVVTIVPSVVAKRRKARAEHATAV